MGKRGGSEGSSKILNGFKDSSVGSDDERFESPMCVGAGMVLDCVASLLRRGTAGRMISVMWVCCVILVSVAVYAVYAVC